MTDSSKIEYWLSVYPLFNCANDGTRYYLWKVEFPHEDKLIFNCKSRYELRIFMDLNDMKIEKISRISRDEIYHKNKIVYSSFIVNSMTN